ncbi:Crp/Fnr family transcriptional regulator [Methylobacterium trifolii]|uniref:Cyclic nucleotide-binding domain-containing protein n=1 Tax=Methylobacterium trifolii TaxID=1003092 RepID=A0ABQ4U503_9HYPH|nr:Crp/Fnr family transcriptional regulator [Methylobacterium trifolii]GJE62184.1 hypothetical protein MPOCJGCO_4314 [Methylobacterium trifolii]
MPPLEHASVRNRLLATLSPDDFDRLQPGLMAIVLDMREMLISAQRAIEHVYFVETGVVSIIADQSDGRIEIGLIGPEGVVGTPILLGADRSPHSAMVQAEGTALRLPASALRAAMDASPSLREILGRYVQTMMVQIGQTAYANADLTIEGRLARWILMTQDRLEQDELPLTHEFLSIMLGVRRPGVTTAIHGLEGFGMIRARRGQITVLDREKLLDLAGDAYGSAEAEYRRLILGAPDYRATSSASGAAPS